jgi:hypothetical protein
METDLRYSEPSSRAVEREKLASAEQWSNWTTDQIRSAVEAERERTFELLTELLVRIKKDMIPEVVATLPALRGPVGPAGPVGRLPIAKEWLREKVYYEGEVITYDGAAGTTSSRSTVARFWRCTTSPVYVPVPAGNFCVHRGNAARQENRDREVPQVLPVRRVTTPKSSLAGLLTAQATLSRQ